MDVDVNRVRVPVKKVRLSKDQCARCGKKGHWAKDCKMPKRAKPDDTPTGRPVGVKTAQTSNSQSYRYWDEQSDSDSDDDEEWPEDM
jgi:hypothetical protein